MTLVERVRQPRESMTTKPRLAPGARAAQPVFARIARPPLPSEVITQGTYARPNLRLS